MKETLEIPQDFITSFPHLSKEMALEADVHEELPLDICDLLPHWITEYELCCKKDEAIMKVKSKGNQNAME